MNNKKKNIIIAIGIIIILVIVSSILLIKNNNTAKSNKVDNNNYNHNEVNNKNYEPNKENMNEIEKYVNIVKDVAENEINGSEEITVISIMDNNKNEYNITNKDIELFKILGTSEIELEKIIEYKIFSIEAQSIGIKLSDKEINEINEMANSEKDLSYIKDDDIAKNKFKERKYNYFLDIRYSNALKNKILNEIDSGKITIDNENVNNKVREYSKVLEEFKTIKNPTEEERKQYFKETYSLMNEIQDLYFKCIKDKYTINYK